MAASRPRSVAEAIFPTGLVPGLRRRHRPCDRDRRRGDGALHSTNPASATGTATEPFEGAPRRSDRVDPEVTLSGISVGRSGGGTDAALTRSPSRRGLRSPAAHERLIDLEAKAGPGRDVDPAGARRERRREAVRPATGSCRPRTRAAAGRGAAGGSGRAAPRSPGSPPRSRSRRPTCAAPRYRVEPRETGDEERLADAAADHRLGLEDVDAAAVDEVDARASRLSVISPPASAMSIASASRS